MAVPTIIVKPRQLQPYGQPRKFNLADNIEVTDAGLQDGLLVIKLVKEVPEAMKPRKIAIANGNSAKVIDHKDAEAA